MDTLSKTAFVGCVGLATALPAFGEAYSLLKMPPQRSTEEAFLQYSRPLEEVDSGRLQKLRELGYKETFRVISFDTICEGLKKDKELGGKASKFDFKWVVENYQKALPGYVQSIPISFCFRDTEEKIHDFGPLSPEADQNKRNSFLTCLLEEPWFEKSKQILSLYDFLLKDKTELKFMMGQQGGFCYVRNDGENRRYIIHFTGEEKFTHTILAHEIKHALFYELGLSGEPNLCSYKTEFIRDVYQLPQGFVSEPLKERSTEAIYNQCPAIAMDWDTIEEAWNMLGFIEIGGVVYINELSDILVPDPKRFEQKVVKFHQPLFMRSYIYEHKSLLDKFAERQNNLMGNGIADNRKMIDFSDDEDEAKESRKAKDNMPRYLKAISVALKIPCAQMSESIQCDHRKAYMKHVKEDRRWHKNLKKTMNFINGSR